MPPAHLESIGRHVGKANAGGFYESDSNLAPVQLPLKDGSIAYVIIAAVGRSALRLAPCHYGVLLQS